MRLPRWLVRIGAAVETVVIGVSWALCLLGVSVTVHAMPASVETMARATSPWNDTGLSERTTLSLAEQVRRYVADRVYAPLPVVVEGRDGFDARSASHLLDVRSVLLGSRLLTGLIAALLAVWLTAALAMKRWLPLRRGLIAGGVVSIAIVLAVGAAALLDFEGAFAWFHSLFFASGTWTFEAGSLLIQVFPERFWALAGVAWGGLVLVLGAALIGGGLAMPKTMEEAMRIPEDSPVFPSRSGQGA
jgi:integral membrane protein (TIGR01906 family)